MNTEPVWTCTSIELFFFGGLLQLPGFLGVADPFHSCTQADIQVYLQLARQSLLQREYLNHSNGSEQPDPALSRLLHAATAAAQVMIAVHNDISAFAYLTSDGIVLQQPMPENQVGFSLLDNLSSLRPRLQALLAVPPLVPAPGTQITIAQPVLEQALIMLAEDPSADQIAACAASLVQIGLPPESAAAFALALAHPASTGYVTIVCREGTTLKRQSGLAWLAATSGGWIAELPSTNFPATVTWYPATSYIIELAVDTLLSPISGSPPFSSSY